MSGRWPRWRTAYRWLADARRVLAIAWRAAPGTLATYLGVSLLAAVLPVGAAWLTKLALDGVARQAPLAHLIALGVGLGVLGLLTAAVSPVLSYLRGEAVRRIGLHSVDRLYGAVNRFVGLSRFEDPVFHDRLRLARESGRTSPSDLLNSMIGGLRGVVTAGTFVASLSAISPVMAAVVVAVALPGVAAERALARRRARAFWQVSPAMRREMFYGNLLTDARAAKEVRLFGVGGFLRERMVAERRSSNAAERAVARRGAATQVGLAAAAAVTAGVGLLWALWSARSGGLTVGDISMFVVASTGVQGALAGVAAEVAIGHQALLLFRHYTDVVNAGPDLPVARRPVPTPPLRRGIELRDVWFRYSDDHPWTLRGINLFLPAGQSTALVGRNGAGKSTLVKLLCRYYDPTAGHIRWDGVDLRDMDPADLRRRIGALFQDFMEYDLTVAENIGLGNLAALDDRERLTAAARLAGIHDRLERLPHGYDTLLSRLFLPAAPPDAPGPIGPAAKRGTRSGADPSSAAGDSAGDSVGHRLSTGEWQRLALARALLRDGRDLLILDEPSSGLDAEAEYQIHQTLRTHRAGSTNVLISHRMGAVRDADHIVVIVDGTVAEEGNHDQLMALGGEYARLFSRQAQGYQEPVPELGQAP